MITLAVDSSGEHVAITVTVGADGVTYPEGTASIRLDTRTKVVPVVDGLAGATFVKSPGEHLVRVDYSGDDSVRPGSADTSFTVPAAG